MKYCTILLSLSALATASLNAGLINDGGFDQGNVNTATSVTIGDVNAGWVANGSFDRAFNSNTTTNTGTQQYGSFLVNGGSGNPNSFLLSAGKTSQGTGGAAGRGTTWQVFSLDSLGFDDNALAVSISLDVAVFSQFINNSVAETVNGTVDTTNANRVRFSLYGFNGDIATSLATQSLDTEGLNSRKPDNSGYAGYTTLIDDATLAAPSAVSDLFNVYWETQTYSATNLGNYDYYILGITGGNQVQGVAIDNVSIAAVPEPSTYIAGLGFIALGYFVYRRRKNAAKTEEKKA